MLPDAFFARLLQLIGAGFLVANVHLIFELVRFRRLRAVLTWPSRRPPFFRLGVALAFVLGVLLVVKGFIQQRPIVDLFGEGMMFVYYAYLVPLSLRIGRGFYDQGVWSERGFLRYSEIGGLSWREGDEVTLVMVPRQRKLALPLIVPKPFYGAARRVLRDKIAGHEIELGTSALDLGARDARDDV